MCLQEPSGRKETKQCISVQEHSQYVQLADTFLPPDCREEGGLPRRELQSDGSGEINTPTGALTEHIKACVLSFQAPY